MKSDINQQKPSRAIMPPRRARRPLRVVVFPHPSHEPRLPMLLARFAAQAAREMVARGDLIVRNGVITVPER